MESVMHASDQASARGYVAPSDEQLRCAQTLVERFAAIWSKPDAQRLRDLMHADTQNLVPPMTTPADREGVVRHFAGVLQRLPDLTIDVLRWAITGNTVMIEWEAAAEVAGQPLKWRGVDVMRLRDDRMYEAQVYWDTAALTGRVEAAIKSAASRAPTSSGSASGVRP
jgi:ketosteroid isomerase-like protein